ncbi:B85 [miniopterid betaherpesvirus 1]|uniref:B85 n=1 Tax=miniopterid betaherpesvirus 1 TaxID=3070189 RepID=I3VQ78_9BETA|nr:B85 [miniopterid betaherpesvirus 1]AFK83922.1 B85 [miniopterid betaherpesvirus 1]
MSESTIFCTFEQKLSTTDVSHLAKLIGAVIPISHRHHLIGHSQTGLHSVIEKYKDYARIRRALRNMPLTVLRRVEGNQMILGVPVHGQSYTIKNTGPVNWEKGDTLVALPPLSSISKNSLLTVGNWDLVLPWIVPFELAEEINQRILLIALLSIDRSFDEVRAATVHLRNIKFREHTFTLPDMVTEENMLWDLKNVCISMSMVANLSTELTLTYVRKLALEDSSMLLVKCQELLGRRGENVPRRPDNLAPNEELAKLSALFVMIRQLLDIVSEQPLFLVCDISADNKSATCIFKG